MFTPVMESNHIYKAITSCHLCKYAIMHAPFFICQPAQMLPLCAFMPSAE